jgi:hypothetical protein
VFGHETPHLRRLADRHDVPQQTERRQQKVDADGLLAVLEDQADELYLVVGGQLQQQAVDNSLHAPECVCSVLSVEQKGHLSEMTPP